MARVGRPPADTMSIVRYLIQHGPMPGKRLVEAAERGDLPLSANNIRSYAAGLVRDGWLAQKMTRGDYYPARDPDTGAELQVIVVTKEEAEAVKTMRAA